jgi:hypothetical protein
MARYSPELLAALRYRYEQTDEPMTALAAECGIGITTLQTLVRKNGWTPRSKRMRDCPPAVRLLEEAEKLVAALPQRESSEPEATPTPTLPLAGAGSELVPPDDTVQMPAPAAIAPTRPSLSPVERLEELIAKELKAEEAFRNALGTRPRPRYDLERYARTLSVLTQTVERLQRMRPRRDHDGDEVPKDIDEFRYQLAERIEAFVRSERAIEEAAKSGAPQDDDP